ncbi:MAG: DUF5009 domain-containing protein [Cyclobacteriaceae bacterium]
MNNKSQRLLSLDFFRGATMFLLIGEFSHLFIYMRDPGIEGSFIHALGYQLDHVEWHGLAFWDLIQPFFTFIVGVAMPLSYAKRRERGDSHKEILLHTLQRCFLLLVFGWALYCIGPGKIVFHLNNVLAQLSVSILIAFLIMQRPTWTQIVVSFILIAISETLYRNFWIEGFDQAFVPDKNFGSWVEIQILGYLSGGHWVPFNAIPTTAHTIWGVLAGKLLMSDKPATEKLKWLAIAGAAGVLVGYGMDLFTPIIKRISTSSFVVVSGGWSLLALALCYYLIDVRKYTKAVLFFAIVGMNPLFIYLFAHVGGADLIREMVLPFTMALFGFMGDLGANMMTSLVTWLFLWYICYFMYRKKIFINI